MEEEGQKQPMERVRTKDYDEDGISKLPDCLLVEILSRLPETKYSVRTGALSKRWKHVWHAVPNLIFVYKDDNDDENVSPNFISFVDKTLTQRHQLKLKKFIVYMDTECCYYVDRYKSQLQNWIRYAVNCNVEELDLWLWNELLETELSLDQFVFISSCFTDLKLSGCILNPTGVISWKNLRSLRLLCVKLDEVLIENILSGSPVLETLALCDCYGYRRLNIDSKSVKKLVFAGYSGYEIVEINAPDISSLSIYGCLWLRKLLLLNVSSLVEANLAYGHGTIGEVEEEVLKGLILKLHNIKVLKLEGLYCFEVLKRLEAKGFIRPSNLKVPVNYVAS